jgi:hypothetical protein
MSDNGQILILGAVIIKAKNITGKAIPFIGMDRP